MVEGPNPAKRWIQEHPALWRVIRRSRDVVYDLLPPHPARGGSGRFHRNDLMLRAAGGYNDAGIERYLRAGRDTAGLMVRLADRAGVDDPGARRWFELGAGYGRIVRWLRQVVPAERIWVADVDPAAVRFCRRELGVHGTVSDARFRLAAPVHAEVTFAISVLTHLPDAGADAFVALLDAVTGPGGVAIFTTHGAHSLATLERYDDGRFTSRRAELERAYAETGRAYVSYGYDGDYGMAWHEPAYVRELVARSTDDRFELVTHEPHGLEEHQDLWVFRRRPSD